MHRLLYVCIPRSQARSSLQARKKVCEYLTQEGFDTHLRFSGHCDYFKVGGRWSGDLTLLRLRYLHPKQYERFCERCGDDASAEEQARFFREAFPNYRGMLPFGRSPSGDQYGNADDAQILDEPLFEQLKGWFSDEVTLGSNPNVIFTTDEYCHEWRRRT